MKSSKKILGASAALGLAVALAAGSTFAWFSVAKKDVAIDPFTLSVEAGSGALSVLIKEDTTINASDFSGATTAKLTDAMKTTKLGPQTLGSSLVADGSTETGNAQFQAMKEDAGKVDFYIGFYYDGTIEDGQNVKIVLDTSSEVTEVGTAPGTEIDITQYANYYIPTGSTSVVEDTNNDQISMQNLIQQGYFSATVSGTKAPAPRAAHAARVLFSATQGTNDTTHKVWSPNEALASGGEVVAQTAPSFTPSETLTGSQKGYWKNNFAGALYNISNGDVDNEGALKYADRVAQKAYSNNVTADGTTELISLAKNSQGTGYLGVMHVQIWLEGTDGDCWNSVVNDQMSVTLKFKAIVA